MRREKYCCITFFGHIRLIDLFSCFVGILRTKEERKKWSHARTLHGGAQAFITADIARSTKLEPSWVQGIHHNFYTPSL